MITAIITITPIIRLALSWEGWFTVCSCERAPEARETTWKVVLHHGVMRFSVRG